MSTATLNGRPLPRRTLNDSIGRLDDILDGLGEAIPATIRSTLQESVSIAVAEGVKAALVEVMTNPDITARIQPPAPAPAQPWFFARLVTKARDAIAAAWDWVAPRAVTLKEKAVTLRDGAAGAAGGVRQRGTDLVNRLRWLAGCRRPIGIALTIGFVLAGIAYLSSPTFASLLTGVAATVSALGIQFALWTRRTVNRLLLA